MPVEDLVLAFGVAPILSLHLLRLAPGGRPEDQERWVVVGDLPPMHFETDDTPPQLVSAEAASETRVDVTFDEPVQGCDAALYAITPAIGQPAGIKTAPGSEW